MGSNYLAAIGAAAPALVGTWREILAEERAGKKFKMEEQLQPARIEREQVQTALTQEHVNQLRQQNVAAEKQRKIDEAPANLKEMLGKIGLFPETQEMVLGQGEAFGIKGGLGTTKQVKEFATKFLEGPHGLKIMQSTAENYSQLYKEAREGYEKISKPDTEGAMKDPNDPAVQKAYKKMKEYEGKASMFGGITLKMRDYFETRDAIEELKNMPGGRDFTTQQIAILQLAGKTGGKAEISKVGLEILKENAKGENKPLSPEGKLAMDLYGKPLSQLTPEQLKEVRDKGITEFQQMNLQQNKELREQSLEQSKRFHDENVQVRKDLATVALGLRGRLPAAQVKIVSEKTNGLDKYAALIDEFKPNYAGKLVLGPTLTGIHERIGTDKDRVLWWKNLKALDIQMRHEMFGAKLTANEQKAWDAVTVNENSNPDIIKAALNNRLKIAKNALDREVEGYEEAGYEVKGGKNKPNPKGEAIKKSDPLGIR